MIFRVCVARLHTRTYTTGTSFSETSGADSYSHLGSGSVDLTPGAGRGSGRAVRQGRAGQGMAVGVIIAGLRFGISGGEKKGETIAVNMEFE